jgi:hypothetical protein
MNFVPQETGLDCCPAVLAMLHGCSLRDAKLKFPNKDFTTEGASIQDILMILATEGYWVAPFWSHCCNKKVLLPMIQGPGFAQVEFDGGHLHLVAISETNMVLDPSKSLPCKLSAYKKVCFIAAVRRQQHSVVDAEQQGGSDVPMA